MNPPIIRPSFLGQRSDPALSPVAMKIGTVLHKHVKNKMKKNSWGHNFQTKKKGI